MYLKYMQDSIWGCIDEQPCNELPWLHRAECMSMYPCGRQTVSMVNWSYTQILNMKYQYLHSQQVLKKCKSIFGIHLKSIMYLGVLFLQKWHAVVLRTPYNVQNTIQTQLKEATKMCVSITMQYPPRCISWSSLSHVAEIAVYCHSDKLNHCQIFISSFIAIVNSAHMHTYLYQYNNSSYVFII